jgi:hypothetical protein
MMSNSNLSRRTLVSSAVALPAVAIPTGMERFEAAANPSVPDPIFAAITQHRSAVETFSKAVDARCELEKELPGHLRKSSIDVWERKIVDTDDPRWIEAENKVAETSNAMDEAAMAILDLEPETLLGALAVLRYMVDHIDRYNGAAMGWPDKLLPDSVDPETAKENAARSPEYFLMQNVAASLDRIARA